MRRSIWLLIIRKDPPPVTADILRQHGAGRSLDEIILDPLRKAVREPTLCRSVLLTH
jgi:hypothetical protein